DGGKTLWLREAAEGPDLKGGLAFNLGERQLGPAGNLSADLADKGGWDVNVKRVGDEPEWRDVTILKNGERKASVLLPPHYDVTWYAVLGDGPAWNKQLPAVVALAYTDRDNARTVIRLYDAATGRPFRQFAGHLLDVTHLSFSKSRPLLVSTAL